MGKLKDTILRPFGVQRPFKMWVIFITNFLVAIGLIGPKLGINFVNFQGKFLITEFGIVLGIILIWIAIWAKFDGM